MGLVDGYGVPFTDFLRETFKFFATKTHQAVVVHLSDNLSNNPDFKVNLEHVERAIDEACHEFSDVSENYVDCKFVYTQTDATDPWPTLADLVGKTTGQSSSVKNRIIFTNSGDFAAPKGYATRYISQVRPINLKRMGGKGLDILSSNFDGLTPNNHADVLAKLLLSKPGNW